LAARGALIVRWTGRGRLADLRSSVEFVLGQGRRKAKVGRYGSSLVVEGGEPLGAAARLAHLPGVAWVAAGLTARSPRELAAASATLARKYLRRGYRFAVEAEGGAGLSAGDVSGLVTSAILDSVRGARVSPEARVRFRAASEAGKGVVGVEVRRGPGGVPMGRRWATCLVSGGAHSSVLAWMSMLAGYRVRLVHARVDEQTLRGVARLYSELCHRGDPRGLKLEVLEGGSVADLLGGAVAAPEGEAFGGFHSGCAEAPEALGSVRAPLYLMPEDRFQEEFESLGVKTEGAEADWGARGGGSARVRRFEGMADDVSAVLDGLR
jgi:hypothetical protein